jgi:hypothetical protein
MWEFIAGDDFSGKTERLKVPGGYIYRVVFIDWNSGPTGSQRQVTFKLIFIAAPE